MTVLIPTHTQLHMSTNLQATEVASDYLSLLDQRWIMDENA